MKKFNLGFVGLSHLGICTSIGVSSFKDFNIICYDKNFNLINNLNNRILDIKEPRLKKVLDDNFAKIKFTNYLNDLKKCHIVYISEDVKTNSNDIADLKSLRLLINKVIKIIAKSTTLVIHSQLQLDFMESLKWPKNQLYYHVETLIFGEALKRVLFPERIIIGCSNPRNKLPKIYEQYLSNFKSKIIKMNYESAELAKISINMMLISNLSMTNQISELCQKTNADWNKISEALKLDKRIGRYSYLDPGLGIAGGNLERDLNSIFKINKKYNVNNQFIESLILLSKKKRQWVIDKLLELKYFDYSKLRIGILGLSYKENTNSVKNSICLDLTKFFKKAKLLIYDPLVSHKINLSGHKRVDTIDQVFDEINILIILYKSNFFKKNLDIFKLNKIKDKIIIDPFNNLNNLKYSNHNLKIYTLLKKV